MIQNVGYQALTAGAPVDGGYAGATYGGNMVAGQLPMGGGLMQPAPGAGGGPQVPSQGVPNQNAYGGQAYGGQVQAYGNQVGGGQPLANQAGGAYGGQTGGAQGYSGQLVGQTYGGQTGGAQGYS